MKKVRMRFLKDFPFYGQPRRKGTEHEVEAQHVDWLTQTGIATPAIEPKRRRRRGNYARSDMTATESRDQTPTL